MHKGIAGIRIPAPTLLESRIMSTDCTILCRQRKTATLCLRLQIAQEYEEYVDNAHLCRLMSDGGKMHNATANPLTKRNESNAQLQLTCWHSGSPLRRTPTKNNHQQRHEKGQSCFCSEVAYKKCAAPPCSKGDVLPAISCGMPSSTS